MQLRAIVQYIVQPFSDITLACEVIYQAIY